MKTLRFREGKGVRRGDPALQSAWGHPTSLFLVFFSWSYNLHWPFPCARRCSECLTGINLLDPLYDSVGRVCCYHPHLTSEEGENRFGESA